MDFFVISFGHPGGSKNQKDRKKNLAKNHHPYKNMLGSNVPIAHGRYGYKAEVDKVNDRRRIGNILGHAETPLVSDVGHIVDA
ncbi:MAG TPA: hypothetical protein VKA69_05185 [Desulfobacteria bacterium]|nr:hypothetical protein [Desulfobacteria bacterium]